MNASFFRRTVTSSYLALALRLYLGYFFIYASVSKIPYPAQFADAIANYRLVPFSLLHPVALILPWVELLAGLFLIIGFMPWTAVCIIGSLLIAFNTMVSINLAWGAPITCGCYDTVGEPIGLMKLLENFLMLAAAIQIYYCNKQVIFRKKIKTAGAINRQPFSRRPLTGGQMHTKPKFKRWCGLLSFCMILAVLTACEQREQYTGVYRAETKIASELVEADLDLKEKGTGVWRMGLEEIPVSWVTKGNELRLYTREGGVVLGEFQDGAIRITLPNAGMMTFRRVK